MTRRYIDGVEWISADEHARLARCCASLMQKNEELRGDMDAVEAVSRDLDVLLKQLCGLLGVDLTESLTLRAPGTTLPGCQT